MTSIKDYECPVCNGNNFDVIEEKEKVHIPFGDETIIDLIKLKCKECDTITEYTKLMDEKYELVVRESTKKSVENMLSILSSKGYNLAAIERALELPQRTISRWKNTGELSSMGLALLRIISTYPWILHVAQNKFEPICARNLFIQNAVSDFLGIYSSVGTYNFSQIGVIAHPANLYIIAKYDFKENKNGKREAEEIVSNVIQSISSPQNAFWEVHS